MKHATPGSISHGTCRTEDLLAAFTRELEWLTQAGRNDRTDAQTQLITEAQAALDKLSANAEGFNDDIQEADYILEQMFDALDEFAPEGHYFGAHPGDGSDFGYWPGEFLE